jgi:hypothetical protein
MEVSSPPRTVPGQRSVQDEGLVCSFAELHTSGLVHCRRRWQLDQQTQVSRTDHRGYRRKKPHILRQADVCWLYGGLIVA